MTAYRPPSEVWRSLAGRRVLLPSSCGFPAGLLESIVPALTDGESVELIAGIVFTGYEFIIELASQVNFTTWQYAPGAASSGRVKYLPLRYSQLIDTFAAGGSYAVDAMVVHLSPPDENGECTFGVSPSYSSPLAARVPRVIGVVNRHMPATVGHSTVNVAELDCVVELDRPLPEFRRGGWDDVDTAVGSNVAAIIPDGATLQIGLGSIPEAVLAGLGSHRDLGLYGMMTDGAMDLMRAGVITGANYTPLPGSVEVGEVVGSAELFDFVGTHESVRVVGAEYAMRAETFGLVPQLIAVNSAIEVDLTGQVNAETVGHRIVSGAGGQSDYMHGALLSRGGRSVIAMRSTARHGGVSRIVESLSSGAVVTTPRTAVTHVVTEHGIAELAGRSLAERAMALAAVAAPDHRAELMDIARSRYGSGQESS